MMLAMEKEKDLGLCSVSGSVLMGSGLEGKEGGGADWGKVSDDEDEIDMAGIELPDNLTFINSKGVVGGVEGKVNGKIS